MRYAVPTENQKQTCPFCKGSLESNKQLWFTCKKCHRSFNSRKLLEEYERMELRRSEY